MAEIGLVHLARLALEVNEAVLPDHRTKFSKRQFTQPQLLAVLYLMRYEDWTFREAHLAFAEGVDECHGTRPPESRVEFSAEVAEGVDDSAADDWRTSWPRSRRAGGHDRERHTNLRSYRVLDLEQGRVAQKSPGSFPGLLTQNSIK
jgi:hypothetical protein